MVIFFIYNACFYFGHNLTIITNIFVTHIYVYRNKLLIRKPNFKKKTKTKTIRFFVRLYGGYLTQPLLYIFTYKYNQDKYYNVLYLICFSMLLLLFCFKILYR